MDRLAAMQAFVRLVELGTFSAVAEDLRIKQSTVSKWIAALEEELNVQLMERTTRTRRVTEAGQVFYERAREILAAYEDTTAALTARDRSPRGLIRVSAPVVFGRIFVVKPIARFMRKHEALQVELVFSDRYVNLVDEGFDVAIRVGVPVDSTFRARTIGGTRRHLVAAPKYLERAPALQTPKDLANHQCLLYTGIGDVWQFERNKRTVRAPVRGRVSANNTEALLTMARAGLGVALLATWLVDPDVQAGRLVTLLGDYEPPPAPIQILTPPGRRMHPRVRLFVDFMAEVFAKGLPTC